MFSFVFKVFINKFYFHIYFLFVFLCIFASKTAASYEDFMEEKTCTTLYSQENFEGDTFILKDFDQSVNTKKDYRSSTNGWQVTGSYKVEDKCTLNFCSGTYFQKTCYSIQGKESRKEKLSIMEIGSANCTCARKCNCDDIHIEEDADIRGRAYVCGSCNSCDSEYILLTHEWNFKDFPAAYKDSVQSIILRKGCNLTVYSNASNTRDERVITNEHTENFQGSIERYKIHCGSFSSQSDSSEVNQVEIQPVSNLTMNMTKSEIPYLIVIGGHSNLFELKPSQCWSYDSGVKECHLTVKLDHFGSSIAQVRVITTTLANVRVYPMVEEYRRVATFDDYLSNHEDLKNRFPIIILCHEIEERYFDWNSNFQKSLQGLNEIRRHILDQKYSNVVHVLYGGSGVNQSDKRNPEKLIEKYEKIINDKKWSFPKPTFIVANPGYGHTNSYRMLVNEHWKLDSQEYWPESAGDKLMDISKNRKDIWGYRIFKAIFQNKGLAKGLRADFERNIEFLSADATIYRKLMQLEKKIESGNN